MKQSRFPEERIIAILREHEAGSQTGMSAASTGQQRDVLQIEGQVWWPGLIRSSTPQGLGRQSTKLKKLLAEAMLDNAMLKDLNSKKW
jgi:putative transposase